MIKLLGIALIAFGFALRWNALLVIVTAGLATGLLAGFSLREIVELTGQFFVDNRALTLPFLLMLPIVGVLERHGLKERVAELMRRSGAATAGRVLWLYQCVRGLTSMFGIQVGNHASMVRPLIAPMASAAAERGASEISNLKSVIDDAADASGEGLVAGAGTSVSNLKSQISNADHEVIRAHAAAGENIGNFFADDIFVAVGALLLVHGTLRTAGVEVSLGQIQLWSAPPALWVIAVGWWRYRALDRRLARKPGVAK